MMILTGDEVNPEDLDDLSVYKSFNAHLAYATRYDETPLDALVRKYYLDLALQG